MRQKLAELEASVSRSDGVEKIERIWLCLRWALHAERHFPGGLNLAALGARLKHTLDGEMASLSPALRSHAEILRELCSEVASGPVVVGPVLKDLDALLAEGRRGRGT